MVSRAYPMSGYTDNIRRGNGADCNYILRRSTLVPRQRRPRQTLQRTQTRSQARLLLYASFNPTHGLSQPRRTPLVQFRLLHLLRRISGKGSRGPVWKAPQRGQSIRRRPDLHSPDEKYTNSDIHGVQESLRIRNNDPTDGLKGLQTISAPIPLSGRVLHKPTLWAAPICLVAEAVPGYL